MANMIIRNNNGVLVWDDGTPVFEMGLIFLEYLEHTANNNGYAWGYNKVTNTWNVNEPTVENIYKELDIIAAEGWRVLRGRSLPSYYPLKWTNAFGPASEWDTPAYWAKVDAYFDTMELMLDYMADKGIGIMFDIWPGPSTFADYLYTIDNTIRIRDWARPDSFFFGAVKKMTQRLCSRFANHPAVMAWEVMGEWDGYAYYNIAPGYESADRGGRGFRDADDIFTDQDLIDYQTNIIAAIREVDTTGRFIGSGIFGQKDVPRDSDFVERWLALNNPTDGASIHHYNGFPAGNHDNSALRDHLSLLRKKSYEVGKPLYIGEHAMQNDHIVNGLEGYQRSDVEYDAIIDAGVQLSFHWEYRGGPDRQATEINQWQPGSLGVHPHTTWEPARKQYELIHSKLQKLRETPFIMPNNLPISEFSYPNDGSATGIATDRTNKYNIPATQRQDGMCISFWYNPRSYAPWGQDVFMSSFDDAGTATALGTYRFPEGDNGWFFRSTYSGMDFGVRKTNGALSSTSLIKIGKDGSGDLQVYNEDLWVFVTLQIINPPYTWTNDWVPGINRPGIRTYVNGIVKGFVEWRDVSDQWKPATSGIVIGGLRDARLEEIEPFMGRGKGGIFDLRTFNRTLTDKEIYELYLSNQPPEGTVSGHWTFENGSLAASVGMNGYTILGNTIAESWNNIPTSTQMVPYTYDPIATYSEGTFQLQRGDNDWAPYQLGSAGELYINTVTDDLLVMDGVTYGGHRVLKPRSNKRKLGIVDNSPLTWFDNVPTWADHGINLIHCTVLHTLTVEESKAYDWAKAHGIDIIVSCDTNDVRLSVSDHPAVVGVSAALVNITNGHAARDYAIKYNGYVSLDASASDYRIFERGLHGLQFAGTEYAFISNWENLFTDTNKYGSFIRVMDRISTMPIADQEPNPIRGREKTGVLHLGDQEITATLPRPEELGEHLGRHCVSLEFWAQGDCTTDMELIGHRNTSDNFGWWVSIESNIVKFNSFWWDNTRHQVTIDTGIEIDNTSWNHYVLYADNETNRVGGWINGTEFANVTVADTQNYTTPGNGTTFMNKNGAGNTVNIADLRFYQRPLTDIEVEHLYMRNHIPALDRYANKRTDADKANWNFYDNNTVSGTYQLNIADSTTSNTFTAPPRRKI